MGYFEGGGRARAVPLHLIYCPLQACKKTVDGEEWLMFVPVVGRSKRAAFSLT